MSNLILKEIIKFKLKMADKVINKLPDEIRAPITRHKDSFIESLREAVDEYGGGDEKKKGNKGLNNIDIE